MSYPGGKNGSGVYQKIINQMPPHEVYIEPFLGGGAIMRLKRPAISSIGIDADGDVVAARRADLYTPGLTLLQGNALEWLARRDVRRFVSGTLIYCDPPYLLETRRQHRPIYRCELTQADHVSLLATLLELRCEVAISGYWSELYAEALHDWRAISFTARTRGGRLATEWLWMNFPEPLELHDYRYLGDNFRERERIQRKTKRWKNKLITMPQLERHAIMAAVAEIRTATPGAAMPAGTQRQK